LGPQVIDDGAQGRRTVLRIRLNGGYGLLVADLLAFERACTVGVAQLDTTSLGPDRVAAIIAGDVERPSDFDGVLYIPYEGDWKMKLAQELEAAGLEVDWNKVMRARG